MAQTLRDLLIQRAARLQERPALTAPGWGTLSYAQLRNRVEGVALGLLARPPVSAVFCATGTAWDWAAEVAAAAAGLTWDTSGLRVPPDVLGGSRFNDEDGRDPYHTRERLVRTTTPFTSGLTHEEILTRLRRLNVELGWDHTSVAALPLARLAEPALRAALWSVLYAGGHAILDDPPAEPSRLGALARRSPPRWEGVPFQGIFGH